MLQIRFPPLDSGILDSAYLLSVVRMRLAYLLAVEFFPTFVVISLVEAFYVLAIDQVDECVAYIALVL